MRSFSQLWPTLKRLLAYGSPWRKPLGIAVLMMWVAAAAEVSRPLLISYFIAGGGVCWAATVCSRATLRAVAAV